jgi:hypothetical protein
MTQHLNIGLVTHGLVIDQPWIHKILAGQKTWEMRSTDAKRRGPIALIQKGTGTVVGVAKLVEVKGPFDASELQFHELKHRVPSELYRAQNYKWRMAWVLADVATLKAPVPYVHKSGAVTWVVLDQNACMQVAQQLQSEFDGYVPVYSDEKPSRVSEISGCCSLASSEGVQLTLKREEPSLIRQSQVPVARDGAVFCVNGCMRGSFYTVGEKGAEKQFSDYQAALSYLRTMSVAKWRRPNSAGNWGIVRAVGWVNVV